jgi:hypothetical protein
MSYINFWKCTLLEIASSSFTAVCSFKNSLEDFCILGYDVVLTGTSLLKHFHLFADIFELYYLQAHAT